MCLKFYSWIPECLHSLKTYAESTEGLLLETKQIKKFFASVFSLMSLQLRRFITNSVESFLSSLLVYQVRIIGFI